MGAPSPLCSLPTASYSYSPFFTVLREVIAPIGRLRHKDREITVPTMGADSPLLRAGAELEGIRLGKIADRHNWLKAL